MAPRKGSYYGPHKQWTPVEDGTVRDLYARTPRTRLRAVLTAALPHRSWGAIVQRAQSQSVPGRGGCAWTPAEDQIIRQAWGERSVRAITDSLPGRAWRSIVRRAIALGFETIPPGFVHLSEAARRIGYARATLLKLCRAASVPMMRWHGAKRNKGRTRGGRICRWLLVDLTEATIAVEAALAHDGETVYAGALRRGVKPSALRSRLLSQGAFSVGKRGVRVLIPSALLDEVAAGMKAVSHG